MAVEIFFTDFSPFLSLPGASSGHGACDIDELDCPTYNDHLGLEAIRSLHRQLDDDDNGDIDLIESNDVSNPSSCNLLRYFSCQANECEIELGSLPCVR